MKVYVTYYNEFIAQKSFSRLLLMFMKARAKIHHQTFERFFGKNLDVNLSIAPFLDTSFSLKQEDIKKNIVSFRIHDSNEKVAVEKCDILSRPNVFKYRSSSVSLRGCMEDVKMKTFETLDDLIEMMNQDFCERRKLN